MLYSSIIGEGNRNLLVLHGFLGMGDNWKTHAKRWSSQGYRVHLIDARNHGRSFWEKEFSYEAMIYDLEKYLMEHKLEKVNLLGHSMGGKTAMLFSTIFSDKVNKLIVVDIGVKRYKPHHQMILKGLSSMDFSIIKTRKEADTHLQNFVKEDGVRQFLLKNLYWTPQKELALRMNIEVLKGTGEKIGEPLLEKHCFTGDTLFLKGEKSDYIKEGDWGEIQSHFPNSSLQSVSKSGHWLHAENPSEFLFFVENWW